MEDSGSALVEGTMFESGDAAGPADPSSPLERGTTLSRYLLVERVGVGGMGVVWAAYDPELDRKLAIKLLRPRCDHGRCKLARTRLIREAQVMARINHPNVIAVHDVGEHDGQVFLAMEFVQGKTLGRWVRTTRRDWREIVAVFVQAGRGLAHAHRAGLVHRDFKPANVLVDADGRARVLDFGLARSVEGPRTDLEDDGGTPGSWNASSIQELQQDPIVTPLTRTGSMLGTPAYMAPEQFENQQFDARADQFAFCVALWEALHHRRPFSGSTIEELSRAVCSGEIEDPQSDMRFPGFIERALRRGLAVDPAERWPSMDALLAELSRDPASGRRRWLIAGALVASFSAALIISPMLGETSREPDEAACPDTRAQLEAIWTPTQRQELGATVLGSGALTPERWTTIATVLDGYASAYAAMRVELCEAAHDGRLAAPGRRERCLEDRLQAFTSTVDLLARGDPELSAGAHVLLGALPSVDACAHDRYVEEFPEAAGERDLADAVDHLRPRLLAARARAEVGAVDRAREELRELADEAEVLGDPALHVAIAIESGVVEQLAGAPERSRELLERGVSDAIRAGQDLLAARAAGKLIDVVGRDLGDPEGGLRWAARAEAWNDRVDAPAVARAERLAAEGDLWCSLGELDSASQRYLAALDLLGLGKLELDRARVDYALGRAAGRAVYGLAQVFVANAQYREAHTQLAALYELRCSLLGPEHPDSVRVAIQLAVVEVELGDWRAAAEAFAQALTSARAGRPTADDLAFVLLEHARFLVRRAELSEAEIERAEVSLAEAIDATREGPRGDWARVEAARLARLRGRLDAAESLLAPLTDVEPLRVAVALERGELLLARSEPERALAEFERVASELRELQGPAYAEAVAGQGRALLLLGRADEARAELERALAIWDELAPAGHPRSIQTLELLAGLAGPESRYRSRAEAIRASLL